MRPLRPVSTNSNSDRYRKSRYVGASYPFVCVCVSFHLSRWEIYTPAERYISHLSLSNGEVSSCRSISCFFFFLVIDCPFLANCVSRKKSMLIYFGWFFLDSQDIWSSMKCVSFCAPGPGGCLGENTTKRLSSSTHKILLQFFCSSLDLLCVGLVCRAPVFRLFLFLSRRIREKCSSSG
jgi:hypothetical protein